MTVGCLLVCALWPSPPLAPEDGRRWRVTRIEVVGDSPDAVAVSKSASRWYTVAEVPGEGLSIAYEDLVVRPQVPGNASSLHARGGSILVGRLSPRGTTISARIDVLTGEVTGLSGENPWGDVRATGVDARGRVVAWASEQPTDGDDARPRPASFIVGELRLDTGRWVVGPWEPFGCQTGSQYVGALARADSPLTPIPMLWRDAGGPPTPLALPGEAPRGAIPLAVNKHGKAAGLRPIARPGTWLPVYWPSPLLCRDIPPPGSHLPLGSEEWTGTAFIEVLFVTDDDIVVGRARRGAKVGAWLYYGGRTTWMDEEIGMNGDRFPQRVFPRVEGKGFVARLEPKDETLGGPGWYEVELAPPDARGGGSR